MSSILLLEDDHVLSQEIVRFLKTKNIICDAVYDGELFLRHLGHSHYDVYLLDINIPKINGLDICKKIRETNTSTPIMMLTAYREIQDKLDAFNFGADDYLVKPFHLEELYIRVKALLRRSSTPQEKSALIQIRDMTINTDELKVFRNGVKIDLTPKEYQLLLILAKANGRILSKKAIAEQIWDVYFESNLNTIEVYINFLRKKIDKDFGQKLIMTRMGYGYYLNIDEE